jgi:hypothetical protein
VPLTKGWIDPSGHLEEVIDHGEYIVDLVDAGKLKVSELKGLDDDEVLDLVQGDPEMFKTLVEKLVRQGYIRVDPSGFEGTLSAIRKNAELLTDMIVADEETGTYIDVADTRQGIFIKKSDVMEDGLVDTINREIRTERLMQAARATRRRPSVRVRQHRRRR